MALDNTLGFVAPRNTGGMRSIQPVPSPTIAVRPPTGGLEPNPWESSMSNNLMDRRRYTFNRMAGDVEPPAPTPAPVTPPPAATPPAATPPPAVATGGQGAINLPGQNAESVQKATVGARQTLSGQGIWNVMRNLPDAYKFAMFNALKGGGSGENDLWATVQHEMFGGDANAMNQWVNYWGHTNENAGVQFDPQSGRFRHIDTGFNLRDAQYTRHLNEFATGQQGTGQWVNETLEDLGQAAWNPSGMSQIGQVPFYAPVGASNSGGQNNQFYATPVGTSPNTGAWGNPAAGSSSFNGPVGGGYLPPYGSPLMQTAAGQATVGSMAPQGAAAPVGTTPAVTVPPPSGEVNTPERQGNTPLPTVTATGVVSAANPYGNTARGSYGYRPRNWR